MKKTFQPVVVLLLLFSLQAQLSTVRAQGTAFTYQGKLSNSNNSANGNYDMKFTLYNTNTGGTPVVNSGILSAIPVSNGLFTTTIDFGAGFFTGSASNYLEIAVRTNGAGTLTTLVPRQLLTPTPYAITAENVAGIIQNNTILAGQFATVSGGFSNGVSGEYTAIGGGLSNNASGEYATVGGGGLNIAYSDESTVSGGYSNVCTNIAGTIGGGQNNTVSGIYATVGGGILNIASGYAATVAGGFGNQATNSGSSVGATVGGGTENTASGAQATVAGGHSNGASGDGSVVGGGGVNVAGGLNATISGGTSNNATLQYTTVGGGVGNSANGSDATVSGGSGNVASGQFSTIGGGGGNEANNLYSTVGGGNGNSASGQYATVIGGHANLASGDFSFAGGNHAQAAFQGDFVWADDNGGNFAATAANQFYVRAGGGVAFYSGTGTNGVQLAPGSGSWSSTSDRNAKENFQSVDAQTILTEVAAMPLTTWNYKTQAKSIRHVGPMAQDFHAAFRVGENDTTISTVDEGGVALAAIQGLNQKLEAQAKQKDAEIQDLKQSVADLKKMVQSLAVMKAQAERK